MNTLAQVGLLRRDQGRPREGVSWLGRAFAIAAQYEMMVGDRIVVALAGLMQIMGEDELVAAWKEAFEGEEPPLDRIRAVMRQLDDEDS